MSDLEPRPCEWPTRSQWEARSCGRTGIPRKGKAGHYGLALCWQHQSDVIYSAILEIEAGALSDVQIEDVCQALVAGPAKRQVPLGDRFWDLAAERDPDGIDRLIEGRVHAKWGAA